MIRRPDTFIVGAPKCGTTSMYHYLGQHPQVFMAHHKETNFFSRDLPLLRRVPDEAAYLQLFALAGDALRIGEASVSYLQSVSAPAAIRRFSPGARILIMVRNPIELVVSLHNQLLWSGSEDQVDLAKALDLQQARRSGRCLPPKGRHEAFLQYEQTAMFAGSIRRYHQVFGAHRVHVSLFEELEERPLDLYHSISRFLGVSDDFCPRFKVANPRKVVPNLKLLRWSRRFPRLQRAYQRAVPTRLQSRVSDGVGRITQRQPALRPDATTRARLGAVFRPDVEELSELMGVDLVSRWLGQ